MLHSSANRSRERSITIEKNLFLANNEDSILDSPLGMLRGASTGIDRIHQRLLFLE